MLLCSVNYVHATIIFLNKKSDEYDVDDVHTFAITDQIKMRADERLKIN